MSTEINTRRVVRSMMSTFPSGNDAECLTKQVLLSDSSNLMNVSGGDAECAPMDAIGFKSYPCISRTDKAPLSNGLLLDAPRGKDTYVYLAGYVNEITIVKYSFSSFTQSVNSTLTDGQGVAIATLYASHKGNYIMISVMKGTPLVIFIIEITISEINYVFRLKITD